MAMLTGPSAAQNLLESIFGARQASAPVEISNSQTNPNAWDFIDKPAARTASAGGTKTAYCVRLCDGRYFAMPRKSGAAMSSAETCSAMCPAAETRVFSGTAIERAVASDGKSYSDIKTAFLFREKSVAQCSCTGAGSGGTIAMDVKDDPTLRRGDIVVTRDGPMVFTGASRADDRERAFVPAEQYAGLSKSVRQELAAMQIARDPNESAALPANAAPATLILSLNKEQDDSVSPVEEAFASFAR